MAGRRRLSIEMTRLAAVAEKALADRSVAQGARDAWMPYQRLWDILHGKSGNPQGDTINGLIRLGADFKDIMDAVRMDQIAQSHSPADPVEVKA
jgi:hypothetical protein